MPQPRFDEALTRALAWVSLHRDLLGEEVHVIRDVYGRVRVVANSPGLLPAAARQQLHLELGGFSPGAEGLVLDRSYFGTEELEADRSPRGDRVWLVDRLVSEQGWRRAPIAPPGNTRRVVFYGLKGGVGRSTTLVALAKHLAEGPNGRRVLVVDLDLESPGATSMLLDVNELPEFGVVDWFVEDAVGQGDDELLRAMVATSRVGEVLVAPALGTTSLPKRGAQDERDGAFVAKLGRAYGSPQGEEFALRLARLIAGLERVHAPDVVLLDSRAGLHDIPAAAVPRLGAAALIFAGATSQTWLGLSLLFSAWGRDRTVLDSFRSRLRLVAAQVPEMGRTAYLEQMQLDAYDLFEDFVYDAPEVENPFSFDVRDPDAPHSPIPVYWRRELVEWDPAQVRGSAEPLTQEQFDAAFSPFLRAAMSLPELAFEEGTP